MSDGPVARQRQCPAAAESNRWENGRVWVRHDPTTMPACQTSSFASAYVKRKSHWLVTRFRAWIRLGFSRSVTRSTASGTRMLWKLPSAKRTLRSLVERRPGRTTRGGCRSPGRAPTV